MLESERLLPARRIHEKRADHRLLERLRNARRGAILHALTTPKPRLRYLVGTDAKLQAAIHTLGGFPAQNWMTGKLLGLSQLRPLLDSPTRETSVFSSTS